MANEEQYCNLHSPSQWRALRQFFMKKGGGESPLHDEFSKTIVFIHFSFVIAWTTKKNPKNFGYKNELLSVGVILVLSTHVRSMTLHQILLPVERKMERTSNFLFGQVDTDWALAILHVSLFSDTYYYNPESPQPENMLFSPRWCSEFDTLREYSRTLKISQIARIPHFHFDLRIQN